MKTPVEIVQELIDTRFAGNQAAFARAIGKPATLVNNWITGERGIGGASIRNIERRLGLDSGHFDGKRPQLKLVPKSDVKPFSIPNTGNATQQSPELIPWNELRSTLKGRTKLNENEFTYQAGESPSKHAFSTKVETDAMAPSIPHGATIIVDPAVHAAHGRYVLVEKGGKEILLRKLIQDGDRMLLATENQSLQIPSEQFDGEKDEIIGVAVSIINSLL